MKGIDTKCRLCGRNVFEIRGWLERVNPKGEPAILECRPHCHSELTPEQALAGAVLATKEGGQ